MGELQQTDEGETISAKKAIDAAFLFFREYVPQKEVRHSLLEGLSFDEYNGQWVVKIGFDLGRRRKVGSSILTTMNLEQPLEEPIREFRTLYINGRTGEFIRME